jgi:hypothetical protein
MEGTQICLTDYEIHAIICINRSSKDTISVKQIYCQTIHSLLDSINNAGVNTCVGENK